MTDGEQSTESFFPRWRLLFSLLENGSKSQRLPTKRIFLAGSWVPGRVIFVHIDLIPWAYTQIHTPTVVQGGGGGGGAWWNPGGLVEPLPGVFDVAVFRNDFAFSGKPLIFSTRWGTFYGCWYCWGPLTSPTMIANLAAIFDFTNN